MLSWRQAATWTSTDCPITWEVRPQSMAADPCTQSQAPVTRTVETSDHCCSPNLPGPTTSCQAGTQAHCRPSSQRALADEVAITIHEQNRTEQRTHGKQIRRRHRTKHEIPPIYWLSWTTCTELEAGTWHTNGVWRKR